jgi:hypothetical protein
MGRSRARSACVAAGLSLLAPSLVAAAVQKPPPPPVFESGIRHGPLVAGQLATFTYRIESADAFTLTLTQLPSALTVLRLGSSPYRLVGGRPTWTRTLPGRTLSSRSVQVRVRLGRAWAGRNVCLRMEERLAYGGVPDVFEKRSCGTVARG